MPLWIRVVEFYEAFVGGTWLKMNRTEQIKLTEIQEKIKELEEKASNTLSYLRAQKKEQLLSQTR